MLEINIMKNNIYKIIALFKHIQNKIWNKLISRIRRKQLKYFKKRWVDLKETKYCKWYQPITFSNATNNVPKWRMFKWFWFEFYYYGSKLIYIYKSGVHFALMIELG